MSDAPKKPRKKHLPDKAELLREIEHWRWQATTALGQSQPWLRIPGLVIYLDTTDSDFEARLEIIFMAIAQLKRRSKPSPESALSHKSSGALSAQPESTGETSGRAGVGG